MENSKKLLIRRIIAIVLMAYTVAFLFLPFFFGETMSIDIMEYSDTSELTFAEFRSGKTEDIGKFLDAIRTSPESYRTYFTVEFIMAILVNVLFFGLIALAAVSVLLMFFNRSKTATVLHTVLSFVTVLVFVGYLVFSVLTILEESDTASYKVTITVYPGVSIILLPLFSLAASILYKKDRSYRGALPTFAVQPLPETGKAPEEPAPEPEPVEAPEEPVCCHAEKPAAPVCTNCGTKLREGVKFCYNCGAKVD